MRPMLDSFLGGLWLVLALEDLPDHNGDFDRWMNKELASNTESQRMGTGTYGLESGSKFESSRLLGRSMTINS